MFALLGFGSIAVWLAFSIWLGWFIAKRFKPVWLKALFFVAIVPLVFVAPVADELIGKYQFEQYCKDADDIKVYGTISVGIELYAPDGKWRLSEANLSIDDRRRLLELKNSLIRWVLSNPNGTKVPAIMPVWYRETRIEDVKTGKPLAEFRIYGTNGGWLSRAVSEWPLLSPAQCMPRLLKEGREEQTVLPFDGPREEPK